MIPTCVEPRRYPVARHEAGEAPATSSGSAPSSTLRGLEQPCRSGAVATPCPRLRLRVICDRSPRCLPDPDRSPCRGPSPTRRGELAAGQIGVSWLPDDLWSRGKCGLKVLQYQAAGLPVVANPVGSQAEMIRTGEDGFLATTPAEWVDAVRQLADDPGLRRRMGTAARRRVEADYSLARLVGDLRPLDDRGTAQTAATGAGWKVDRPARHPETGRASSPTPPRPGPLEPQTDRPPMSVCTPQERPPIATPLPPSRRCRRPDVRHPPAPDVQAAGLGMDPGSARSAGGSRVGWRDILLGPDGLRLDEWRRTGSGSDVKAGPHRVVYHIELPEGAILYQALPGPGPPGDPPPVVPSRQGTQRGEASQQLATIGVPTISPLALGEQRKRGFLFENYLVTPAIADADPPRRVRRAELPGWPEPRRSCVRQKLAEALGVMTARLHDAGFLHLDFHPGNILVRFPTDR